MQPIFRDRDELAASTDLTAPIEAALAASRALIVLCSPAAAASREPYASDVPGHESDEAFPPALRFAVAADGTLSDRHAEPMAADLRATADGRRLGKLKLIAGLLGVGLDELVRRETVRRNRRFVILAAASLGGMVLTTGLAAFAFRSRADAVHQREQADGLIEFSQAEVRALEAQDRSNALWIEMAVKSANIRAEALMMRRDWAAAATANAWALDHACALVATDHTVASWRSDCLLPARWMNLAILHHRAQRRVDSAVSTAPRRRVSGLRPMRRGARPRRSIPSPRMPALRGSCWRCCRRRTTGRWAGPPPRLERRTRAAATRRDTALCPVCRRCALARPRTGCWRRRRLRSRRDRRPGPGSYALSGLGIPGVTFLPGVRLASQEPAWDARPAAPEETATMDDNRIWEFERELWLGGAEVYRQKVSTDVVMALPTQPFLFDAEAAIAAVTNTPLWDSVEFTETRVHRPQEGLIVIAYRVSAKRGEEAYNAACTSTLRWLSHEHWDVVQHSQLPFGVMVADPDV